MPSNQQIQAKRENAQLSTGPTTETGKQASRSNSLRHGLTATSIENFPLEVREDYANEMAPASHGEQLRFELRQHHTNQTALCVVYGEKQRERFINNSTLRNEANPNSHA